MHLLPHAATAGRLCLSSYRLTPSCPAPPSHNVMFRAPSGTLVGTDYNGNKYYENNNTAAYGGCGRAVLGCQSS